MKIIVATPLYPPEGERISIHSRELARHLSVNHQVTVLAYGFKVIPENNFKIIVVDKTRPLIIRLFNYTKSLLVLAKKHDLIYVQNARAVGLPAILVKYFTGTPVIVNFFEDEAYKRAFSQGLTEQNLEVFLEHLPSNKKIRKIIRIQSWILRQATLVLVSSNYLKELVARIYKISPEKILVNYLPEDRQEILPLEAIKNPRQIIAHGPLLDWAGFSDIIQAVARLKEKFQDIQLVISGAGRNKNKLLDLAKQLKLADNVKFVGRVSRAENWYLLKTSSAYIHNFSGWDQDNQITKSFLAEVPVIAQDNHLHREILSSKASGLLFDGKKPESLAKQIGELLENPSVAKDLKDQASQNLAENFSWTSHLRHLNQIFSSGLKK